MPLTVRNLTPDPRVIGLPSLNKPRMLKIRQVTWKLIIGAIEGNQLN